VEYDVEGINQVQINSQAGITFASGLRSILRQDPDIIMVGEIRDVETAEIAVQAAQTGHLVLSTLHTNDAPSAVSRLLDLGIDAYLIADSLVALVGQRLVRRICEHCKIPDPLDPEIRKKLLHCLGHQPGDHFSKGSGCEACQYTGYSGRIGLFELLIPDNDLKEMISKGTTSAVVKKRAESGGFRSMSLDGIYKAQQGLTTIEEVLRVAPPSFDGIKDIEASSVADSEDQAAEIQSEEAYMSSVGCVRPSKILVADDDEIVVKVIRNLLETEDHLVATAKDGLEALKLALRERPDLIITDYLMPKMDGNVLIKKIRGQLTTRYIPIIMLTAKEEIESEMEETGAGADDYLTKPVNPEMLLASVGRLLKRAMPDEE
jgi:type IV pilus assembly protein PilB